MLKRLTAGRHARMYGKWTALAVLLMAMVLLAACGGADAPVSGAEQPSGNANLSAVANGEHADAEHATAGEQGAAGEQSLAGDQSPAGEQNVGATAYPLSLADALGTALTFEQAPQRVVSLAPSETEVLFAIDAGDAVVGADDNSNYPAETANLARVGGFEANIEAIAALNPDLVIANASINEATLGQLGELGITVFASLPKSLDETIAHIETVGRIMDKQAEAKAVADRMRADRAAVVEAVKDVPAKRVYLEFSPGWTVGGGEFLDELVTLAGGMNIAADETGWFEIDPEQIVQSNPEVIIYPDIPGNTEIPDAINSRPGWNQLDAVKNGQVYAVTNDPLVRVGPRLTEGLKEIARAIHPDRFE